MTDVFHRCPRCDQGHLLPHCPPMNRCGWYTCDLSCGFRVDIVLGISTLLRRGKGALHSGRDDDQDEEESQRPGLY